MPHHWNEVAGTRRRQIEAGLDLTFSKIFVPYFRSRVLALKPEIIIEVGAGTGHLALSLHGNVDQCILVEPSIGMYSVAREVLRSTNVQLVNSAIESFSSDPKCDLLISHMCIQTVEHLQRFLNACHQDLKTGGVILASLPHPAFYNDYKTFFDPSTFNYMKERSKLVSFSITLEPSEVIDRVPYYHRPLSHYISGFTSAGFCITGFDEIFPSDAIHKLYGNNWKNPRYLVLGGHSNL